MQPLAKAISPESSVQRAPFMRRVGSFVVTRRWSVVAAWLAVTLVALVPAGRLGRNLDVAAIVRESEAVSVDSVLLNGFHSPFARYAVLVAAGIPAPNTDAGAEVLRSIIASVDSVPGVSATLSYRDAQDSVFLPATHGTFAVVGLQPPNGKADQMVPRLRAATQSLSATLRRSYPGVTLRWTGNTPINYDIRAASAEQGRRAELAALPLTLALLVLAFGAIAAALLPAAVGLVAIVSAFGLGALVNSVWPLSIVFQNMATMIGLGVGVDYALLTVARFRESLRSGSSTDAAAVHAAEHAGHTIAISGLTVLIGFVALLTVPLNELQSVGISGILVVACSMLIAVTLLPALLAIVGARVNRFSVRSLSERSEQWWQWWGEHIVRRPLLVLIVAAAPLLALAFQARRLNADLPRGNWLPSGIESGKAIGDLTRMGRGSLLNTVRVLVQLPPSASLADTSGWSAVRRLTASLGADARVHRAASVATAFNVASPPPALFELPGRVQRSLMSPDWRQTVIELTPADSLELNDVTLLVRALRESNASALSGLPGTRILVGGIPALNADYSDAISARVGGVVISVVAATLLTLMVAFRSVLVPVKAVVLNLLSVGAAFGAVVLVFQDGSGASLMGVDGPMHGVFPTMPILVFCVVFGLSMDYEIFLLARVAELRRVHDDRRAVTMALARTGGIITSAAAIMITVFAAFALGSFIFIKVLGFALAVAVLIDATLVRMAIGPALLVLAGKWNWWPGGERT